MMNHLDQIAWQREVILEEFYDSLAERKSNSELFDEEDIEDLLLRKKQLQ